MFNLFLFISYKKIEERYEKLIEELLEEQKKLEKINKKIKKHEMIESINLKESEIPKHL